MRFKSIIRRFFYGHNINDDSDMIIKLRKKLKVEGGSINPFFLLSKRQYNKICVRNQSFFPLSAKIGDDVVFPHGICGIFISQGAVIGDNAVIFHQVTIGSNTLSDSKNCGASTLGNNVFIGAGAKIIGNIHVGDNVRIGANAVVTTDIPNNTTVVLEHPRIIIHETARDNSFNKFN